MAVPSGFSVGDFLAVADLTWRIVQALKEGGGSVPEVQAILETLILFDRTITTCRTLVLEWAPLSSVQVTISESSIINGVNYQLKLCRQKLTILSKEIEPYTRSFMKQPNSRTCRDHLRKIKWLFRKEDAEKLQKDLLVHIQGPDMFVTSLQKCVQFRSYSPFTDNLKLVVKL
jgi:hypothetical protein